MEKKVINIQIPTIRKLRKLKNEKEKQQEEERIRRSNIEKKKVAALERKIVKLLKPLIIEKMLNEPELLEREFIWKDRHPCPSNPVEITINIDKEKLDEIDKGIDHHFINRSIKDKFYYKGWGIDCKRFNNEEDIIFELWPLYEE